MQTRLNPYIGFKDTARQAMEFYQSVLGGELTISSFEEANMAQNPEDKDKIMHAMLETDNGLVLMASDTPAGMEYRQSGSNVSLSLSGDNESELRGYFEKLSDAGTVTLPLDKAPWGDYFGMCTDKFGVSWMVNISGTPAASS